jgi:hypothetical protein
VAQEMLRLSQKGTSYSLVPIQKEKALKRDAVTNSSIEKQVCAKIVSELWQTGKLDKESLEVKGLCVWLRAMLPANENSLVDTAKKMIENV